MAESKRSRTQAKVNFAIGKGLVETRAIRDKIVQTRKPSAKWIEPSDGVLRYSRAGSRTGAALGAAVAGAVCAIGLWQHFNHGPAGDAAIGMIVVGGGFFLVMLFIATKMSSRTFDRNTGSYSQSGLFGSRKRPLAEIIAIQLITHHVVSPKFESSKDYSTYQLNLVLDSADTPRENLATHGDIEAIRSDGKTLATFLGVPLLDQIELSKNNFL